MKRNIVPLLLSIFFQVCYTDTLVADSDFSSVHSGRQALFREKIARGVKFARDSFSEQDMPQVFAQGKSAIIAFHGLGDSPHSGYRYHFSQLPDIPVFVPHMPYSGNYLRNKLGVISMGGITDLAAAFAVIKQISDAGYEKIGLYGFSCGGAIVINILHALAKPEQFAELFQELGINPSLLKEKIKGCIVDRPFCSYRCSVEANAGKFKGFFVGLYGYRNAVSYIFNNSYCGNVVSLDGVEPLEAAASISDVPLCIHAATDDVMVGFKGVEELQKILQQKNPLIFVKSYSGHVDPISPSLKNVWTDFFQKYLQ